MFAEASTSIYEVICELRFSPFRALASAPNVSASSGLGNQRPRDPRACHQTQVLSSIIAVYLPGHVAPSDSHRKHYVSYGRLRSNSGSVTPELEESVCLSTLPHTSRRVA